MQTINLGSLYVVATPIGNLLDFTQRAIEVLKTVAYIAVEDTRHAKKLLQHYAISTTCFSLHEYNEAERIQKILHVLHEGKSIALISDAGTPLISDPGYRLVSTLKQQQINIIPVPGACAAIAALSVSGLATDQFIFIGFLPAKVEGLKTCFTDLSYETRTIISYVAPHRLMMTLDVLKAVFADQKRICIARELTKMHEDIITATIPEVIDYYQKHTEKQRGEIVLLMEGTTTVADQCLVHSEVVLDILLAELPIKQAAQLTSQITGKRKNELYQLALAKQQK